MRDHANGGPEVELAPGELDILMKGQKKLAEKVKHSGQQDEPIRPEAKDIQITSEAWKKEREEWITRMRAVRAKRPGPAGPQKLFPRFENESEEPCWRYSSETLDQFKDRYRKDAEDRMGVEYIGWVESDQRETHQGELGLKNGEDYNKIVEPCNDIRQKAM